MLLFFEFDHKNVDGVGDVLLASESLWAVHRPHSGEEHATVRAGSLPFTPPSCSVAFCALSASSDLRRIPMKTIPERLFQGLPNLSRL